MWQLQSLENWKSKASETYIYIYIYIYIYMPGALWDKFIDFPGEPVVQCDVPLVKNASH